MNATKGNGIIKLEDLYEKIHNLPSTLNYFIENERNMDDLDFLVIDLDTLPLFKFIQQNSFETSKSALDFLFKSIITLSYIDPSGILLDKILVYIKEYLSTSRDAYDSILEFILDDELNNYLGLKIDERLVTFNFDHRYDIVTNELLDYCFKTKQIIKEERRGKDFFPKVPNINYKYKYLNRIYQNFQTINIYRIIILLADDKDKIIQKFLETIKFGLFNLDVTMPGLSEWIQLQLNRYLPLLNFEQIQFMLILKEDVINNKNFNQQLPIINDIIYNVHTFNPCNLIKDEEQEFEFNLPKEIENALEAYNHMYKKITKQLWDDKYKKEPKSKYMPKTTYHKQKLEKCGQKSLIPILKCCKVELVLNKDDLNSKLVCSLIQACIIFYFVHNNKWDLSELVKHSKVPYFMLYEQLLGLVKLGIINRKDHYCFELNRSTTVIKQDIKVCEQTLVEQQSKDKKCRKYGQVGAEEVEQNKISKLKKYKSNNIEEDYYIASSDIEEYNIAPYEIEDYSDYSYHSNYSSENEPDLESHEISDKKYKKISALCGPYVDMKLHNWSKVNEVYTFVNKFLFPVDSFIKQYSLHDVKNYLNKLVKDGKVAIKGDPGEEVYQIIKKEAF